AQVVREKHRFQRIPHRCHVSLESRGEKWEGETMDLSLGGMLLEAGASFPFAEKVEVRLKIPNQKEPLRASGRVVRVSREGCQGVEFIKFAPGAGELLQTFLLPAILAQIGEPQAEKSRRTDHWV
ncbi:MAG: PilZ domain-containing protein, partial [Acidobacteria bacterium]|nr:PilZ domain-containing protein [Acidobacteriota bacterium]